MEGKLEQKLEDAVWIARSLFARNKTAGSTANMSFRHGNRIYISGSGTCFGTLTEADFSVLNLSGEHLEGRMPSKEFPLHMRLYEKSDEIGAVLHTHSLYSALWSCLDHENETDCIPEYTPYLKMKLGTVGVVPYGKPGSQELFEAFEACVDASDGYLLRNHGPIVPGKDLMGAFYSLEELEESAHIAWELNGKEANRIV